MKWRVATGGLHTECSTYNPVAMRLEDFRVLRGDAILGHADFTVLNEFAVDWQPLLHARAVPGGPIARPVYDAFLAEFLAGLRAAAPLDGVFLSLHGAVHVQGMDDAEGDWTSAVRAAVGPDCLIAASYDLHGNVSQKVVDSLDMLAAYRTAPHIDVEDTRRRAVAMLLRALGGGPRPFLAWVRVPVLLPGERTSTADAPAAGLYAALPCHSQVWEATLLVGYVWADEPRATASAVVTGTDAAAMRQVATKVAISYWDAREAFAFGAPAGALDDMLDRALASDTRPVILADSGDNPTGGGVGDRADVLRALLACGATDTILAGIADRPATEACHRAGLGATISLRIGATLDPSGVAVDVEATVLHLTPAPDLRAVVAIGGIRLVLTALRRPFHDLADFEALGLDIAGARLLVVKSGYLSPDLARLANPNLLALTDGVVNQDVAALPARRIVRPMFPWDRDFDWTPAVRFSARAP